MVIVKYYTYFLTSKSQWESIKTITEANGEKKKIRLDSHMYEVEAAWNYDDYLSSTGCPRENFKSEEEMKVSLNSGQITLKANDGVYYHVRFVLMMIPV